MKNIVVYACLCGLSMAVPFPRQAVLLTETDEEGIPAVAGFQNQPERQGVILGALGGALAPIVGAVIGPLFTNAASGLTSLLGINRPTSSSSTTSSSSRPAFDAYMIQVPGAEGPYMLLTQENTATSNVKLNWNPNLPFQATSVGKVHLRPQPVQPLPVLDQEKLQEEQNSHDRGSNSPPELETP